MQNFPQPQPQPQPQMGPMQPGPMDPRYQQPQPQTMPGQPPQKKPWWMGVSF
jgi:hypothetical protein